MAETKKCKRCGVDKPRSEYQKHPAARDGLKYNCNACRAQLKRERYAADGEYRARQKSIAQKWRAENRDQHRASARDWYSANQDRGKANASKWSRDNRDKKRQIESARRAAYLLATPKWVDTEQLRLIYAKAAKLGFEVDHIVPLKSRIVCGLHCASNLQLMRKSHNSSKGNRWWPEMP